MVSFCTEDATTPFIYGAGQQHVHAGQLWRRAQPPHHGAVLRHVRPHHAPRADGLVLGSVRDGTFCNNPVGIVLAGILAPCLAVALVCYFGVVAWAVYAQQGGHPVLEDGPLIDMYVTVVSWLLTTDGGGLIVLMRKDGEGDSDTVWARLRNPVRTLPRFVACRQLEHN